MGVELTVADDGPPFDPLAVAPPKQALRLEDVVSGGQGIHLIRHFTDRLAYRREDGRNVLTLWRALAGSADAR
jgi:anti-sigma regulatory factor (Ser/Thr protein kinase)